MEIRPASLAQITRARGGQLVEVTSDVQGVANGLHEIDHHIRLRFSEAGGYFVVYWKPDGSEEGDGYQIFTANELDHRIVHKMREVYHRCQQPGYSLADELEREESKAKREAEHNWEEQMGEVFQRLGHAMRKDLGYAKGSAFFGAEETA